MKNLFNQNRILGSKLILLGIFSITCIVGAQTTDFRSQLPQYWHQQEKDAVNTVSTQFVQKAGATMVGNITYPTGKGPVFSTGTVATARMGTVTLASGLYYLTNTTLTTATYVFINKLTTNTPSWIASTVQTNGTVGTGGRIEFLALTNTVAGTGTAKAGSDASVVNYLLIEGTP